MLIFRRRPRPCIVFGCVIFVCFLLFSAQSVLAVGFAVVLHEAAHIAVCRFLKIKVLGVRALPWGVTADVPLINEPLCQAAVSLAGPMFNFVLLSLCPVAERLFGVQAAEVFALANFANGFLNLIPALPLDGGVILKSVLSSWFGFVRGYNYAIRITAFIGTLIFAFGIFLAFETGYNFSYLAAGLFILFNLIHERTLAICIKKRVFTGEARSNANVKRLKVDAGSHAICLAEVISPTHTVEFCVTKNGKCIGKVTQKRLIQCVLKNAMITVGECIEKF